MQRDHGGRPHPTCPHSSGYADVLSSLAGCAEAPPPPVLASAPATPLTELDATFGTDTSALQNALEGALLDPHFPQVWVA